MALTGQELTKLALERLAGGSPSELVRVLRLSEITDSQHIVKNIERWRDGKHEPSYGFAIRALDRLGLLRDEPGERSVAADAPVPVAPHDLLEGLASVVAVSQSTNEAILERLERIEHALQSRGLDGGDPLSADGG